MQGVHDGTIHRRRILVDEGRLQTELVQICRNGISVFQCAMDENDSLYYEMVSVRALSMGTAFEDGLGNYL